MTGGVSTLGSAVVDSSAIMSIFEERLSAAAFREGLSRSSSLFMSSATLLELSVVFTGKRTGQATVPLDALLSFFNIQVVPFDRPMVDDAREACVKFGRKHSPADLNFGDLFSYALAKRMGIPLFFEGLDFSQTDIGDAMKLLGYSFDSKHSPILDEPADAKEASPEAIRVMQTIREILHGKSDLQ